MVKKVFVKSSAVTARKFLEEILRVWNTAFDSKMGKAKE